MFLSSWSIALTVSSLIALFLLAIAARTALRVLLSWNANSDGPKQIQLENEIWLSSTLVAYALGFQILTLIIFVLAADSYGQVIAGAMCATGALLANDYGMPVLLLKLVGVFFYGFWILLHQLDIQAETYPLVKAKYIYLILLLPLIITDITGQTIYIARLSPDIITSCCAVVFGSSKGGGPNLIGAISQDRMLVFFYGALAVLFGLQLILLFYRRDWLFITGAAGWISFFVIAIVAIITVISSYVYAMPYHNCPFCLLKPEYNYIGFIIYGSLITATFFGMTPALIAPLKRYRALLPAIEKNQRAAAWITISMLFVFGVSASFHLLRYMLTGGEF